MTSPLTRAARALAKSQSGVDEWDSLDEAFQASLIENVRAVLEAQWQPIETAPMDGTHILIHYRHGHGDRWTSEGWFHDNGQDKPVWMTPSDYMVRATHWMPLPKQPQ